MKTIEGDKVSLNPVVKALAPILAAATLAGCAGMQAAPVVNPDVEQVYQVPGVNQDEIFDQTKVWIAENFNSGKAVLELANKDQGLIIGNGITTFPCDGINCLGREGWKVPFTLRVDMKDERFRAKFINIELSMPGGSGFPGYEGPVPNEPLMAELRPKLKALGEELRDHIQDSDEEDDW